MDSQTLRERFVAFFEARDHSAIPSDSLIPSGDPTVLFTSAGMNQFKDYFLGKRTDLRRAASCQKCLRTGDLERVGRSPSHHTFFEMLGNFSFGDYFKREAIQWAWEFLTGTLEYAGTPSPDRTTRCVSLPAEKLWVSVYEDDEEASELWRNLGVPSARIKRFGQADNFWPANAPTEGPNGPCGPCSEIYFDPDGKVQGPRSVEVWNLVFTQYDRQSDGSLKELPRKNIDTGMGLERLASLVQGVASDYETDLFAPIVEAVRRVPRRKQAGSEQATFTERAIADHLRAIVFLIGDGVLPSNESRGYVLRMLIRRAYRLGLVALDASSSGSRTVLSSLVPFVEEAMKGSPYAKTLTEKRQTIQRVIEQEELQFVQTLEAGTARLEQIMDAVKSQTISGKEAFKLYDTYGFPLELTVDIAQERQLIVDRKGFEVALAAQQERSRAASQFGKGIFVPPLMTFSVVSKFVGYESLQANTKVEGIWKDGQWASSAREGDEIGVVLTQSPFYGEAGGQVGDQGVIECPHGLVEVVDVKWFDELLVHHGRVRQGTVATNEAVRAEVNAQRRTKIARSHTATHLLHWALRKVLGPETVQAGSLVEVERVRFDFSALGSLHEEQQAKVEQLVNDRIRAADQVDVKLMKLEEAKKAGAVALFGEKYAQQVRVVSIGDYSRELCGGTHLVHTGSIGTFRIVTESSIAAGTRRLEAVVGEAALARQQEEARLLRQVAQQFSRPPEDVLQGLEELLSQLKATEKKFAALKLELAQAKAKQLVADAKRIDGVTVVASQLDGADRDFLFALADVIRGSISSGIVLLVSVERPSNVAWVIAATTNLVGRINAGQILKTIAPLTQGSGGGRPDFAQGGGKDPTGIPAALKRAEELIRQALEGASR